MSVRVDTVASTYKNRDGQDLQHFVAEIYADETSDISGKTTFGTIVADPNSTAYVVQSGKLYVMGGDSVWYDTDGEAIS